MAVIMFPKNYKNCVIYTGTSRILIYFSLENPCFCHNLTICEVIAGKFSGLLPNLTIVFAEYLPKSQNVCIFRRFLSKNWGNNGKNVLLSWAVGLPLDWVESSEEVTVSGQNRPTPDWH